MATDTLITTPYRLASGEGLADVWWKTGRCTVKTSASETAGGFSQVEILDPRGTAPPMHIHHNDDEAFYVLEGELTLFADGARIDAGPGDYVFVPRGTTHAYLVRSGWARVLVTFSPAGFEDVFVRAGVEVTGAEPPADAVLPSPEEFVRLLAPYGCETPGPPPTLDDLV